MSTVRKHIVILGSGPAGLGAALSFIQQNDRFTVTVIDKGEIPGGLATGHKYGNNWYDMGVHMMHYDKKIFPQIEKIMGDERIEVDLNATIKWAGRSFRYPLQFIDLFKCIPFFKLCHQVITLFLTQVKFYIFPKAPKNAEEALIQLYGKPLYKYFFEEFTHRYWNLHPTELSQTFISTKMPKLTAVDIIKKILEKFGIRERNQTTENALTKEILHYSRTGAETMPRKVAQAIREAGGSIIQNAAVKMVFVNDNSVKRIGYQENGEIKYLDCDACISTIPIPSLINAIDSYCPAEVKAAANQLQYKAIVIYGLLVKKSKCLDSLYVYYRNRVFHRVGEPKNAGMIVNPPDHSVLIVEMTCEMGDDKWQGKSSVKEMMIAQLAEEGICTADDIVEIHISRDETGYPIFNLGFEPYLKAVKDYIAGFSNLQTTGRQGAFTYPNMHTAMRMGQDAAEIIMEGSG